MDNELFELCKEVKEATGWVDTDCGWYSNGGKVHDTRSVWHKNDVFDKPDNVPLYTSDYLLEKLPTKINDTSLVIETDGKIWWAHYLDENYIGGGKLYRETDTPLKALLR
jgi:hypothetical protein